MQHKNLIFPQIPSLSAVGRVPLANFSSLGSVFGAGAQHIMQGNLRAAETRFQQRGER